MKPAVVSDNEDDMYFLTQEYSGCHEDDLVGVIECYLNLPDIPHPDCNPLNYVHICELQQQDEKLLSPALSTLTTTSNSNWMMTLMTSSAIKRPHSGQLEKLLYLTRWCLTQSSGSTKSWGTRGTIG